MNKMIRRCFVVLRSQRPSSQVAPMQSTSPWITLYIFNGAAADPLRIITVGDANSTTSILVRTAAPAKQTITVNLAVQQSALDAYNKRNDANYELLPAEFYTLSATSLTIEQGKVSTPELTVTIKPFTEELSKTGKKYAIPLYNRLCIWCRSTPSFRVKRISSSHVIR